jgi:hypothetical protein
MNPKPERHHSMRKEKEVNRPWLYALIVLIFGCYFVQPAVRMIERLKAGKPLWLGPALQSHAWWLPTFLLVLAAASCFVSWTIWRGWRRSWELAGAFWIVYAILLTAIVVMSGRGAMVTAYLPVALILVLAVTAFMRASTHTRL